ncbi:MAG: GIY-YIG nuclease family protein [Chitinophagaceae bacterium]
MFVNYILRSEKDGGYYFGHCSDLGKRLQQHNNGKVRSTKSKVRLVVHCQRTPVTGPRATNSTKE